MAGKPEKHGAEGGRNGNGVEKAVHAASRAVQHSPDENGVKKVGGLEGRPLLVRSGKQAKLKQAQGIARGRTETRSREMKGVAQQYLVRVQYPLPDGLADLLKEISAGKCLRFLPTCWTMHHAK